MKKYFKKGQSWVNAIIICLVMVSIGFQFKPASRVAFVRSNELVYGYKGMIEANAKQESKTNELKSNIDTLQIDLQRAINRYNTEYASLSAKEREEKEKILRLQQDNLKRYAATAEKTIGESDKNLTQGVLNQINTLVEQYAKENKYDLVFGTTSSGNILYGESTMDITGPVLDYLNNNYSNIPDSLR
jgi:Skp family chaperone for outer membrane proteins